MALRNSNVGKHFNFRKQGKGVVADEARKNYEDWSSVIQILEFRDKDHKGEIDLRFGYCNKQGKLIARPLCLTEDQLTDLGKKAAKKPEIRKLLKNFCDQIR